MIENPENSLPNVTGTASATSVFGYDGDGNRVRSTINTTTTAFIGNHTEWNVASSSLTRYYYAGSTRVAMRKNNTVYYLLSDHLGSTNLTTDENGQNPVKQYYLPWGEVRYSSGSLQTKHTYTGQYSNVGDFGLMYYKARWYDSALGRFTSADTIIPQPGNPQDWDRYSYVHNSPTNKADPSGHMPIQGCGDEGKSACTATQQEIQNWVIFQYESNEIKCQEGNRDFCIGFENGTSRPITGIQYGSSLTMDLFYGKYIYEQTDYLLDWKSGTIFKVLTEGEGTYVGTINGAALEGYFGWTNVYGAPRSATPKQVMRLLSGPNNDYSGNLGVEIFPDYGINSGYGISIDQDLNTGKPAMTSVGPLFSTESTISLAISVVPFPADGSVQVGSSNSTAEIVWQIPWWPFSNP